MTAENQLTSTYVLKVDSLVLLTIAAKKVGPLLYVMRTIDNLW